MVKVNTSKTKPYFKKKKKPSILKRFLKKLFRAKNIYLLFVFGLLAIYTYFDQGKQNTQTISDQIIGTPIILDGDTLRISDQMFRLIGIDAPELNQQCQRNNSSYQCGLDAKNYLEQLIRGRLITCKAGYYDQYGRILTSCFNYNNIDINADMVKSGNAISYPDYISQQEYAKNNKLGLWAGSFIEPRIFRNGVDYVEY